VTTSCLLRSAVSTALLVVGSVGKYGQTGASPAVETFEGPVSSWVVNADTAGGGTVEQTTARAAAGLASARVATVGAGDRAQVRVNFSDPAAAHTWAERPGTWFWQRTSVYVPSSAVAQLGTNHYVTLAGVWPSSPNTYGGFLRVRQGGALSVLGFRDWDNAPFEFPVYGTLPLDRWFQLELGLHSQAGPGVKRAFAFLIDGDFYGWYHQGRMKSETYDRAAVGVLNTNTSSPFELFVDDWGAPGTNALPTGPDNRSTAPVQEQDYRNRSGVQWQIDWTTWGNNLRLDPQFGLYSASDRLQSGRNIDRTDVSNGWAEIEIDWPRGTPPMQPTGYFGPMVGFRKEINREQNLEVIPIGGGGGQVDLVLQAWDGYGPVFLAQWPMPMNASGTSAIPEPGDIIRARWQQVTPATLEIRASYFDASGSTWHTDVIDGVYTLSSINGINYFDGHHTASSVTIDSIYYSIRRYRLGTADTDPDSSGCTATISAASESFDSNGGTAMTTVTSPAGCAWTAVSHASWITVTEGASGTGNGTVSYSVAPNPTGATRTGTITIAGQTLTVTQTGITCSYTVSPTSVSLDASAATGTVSVGAAAGCTWTAVSNDGWMTVTAGNAGSGDGTASYSVAANSSPSPRTGSLTVAGQGVAISQEGAPEAPPPSSPVTLSLQVDAPPDDVNEVNNTLTSNATTLWLGNAGSTSTSYAGFAFGNVTIPAGATINSARLEVYSSQDQWITLAFSIAADQTGNSAPFASANRPSQRIQTTARVSHSSNVRWLPNTWYVLEEMKAVIQEIIDRPDWQPGNRLSIIIKGSSTGTWGRKFIGSVEAGATKAPKLVVTYTTN
jgi:hypothetical protein